jgi:hypothetical protein
MFASELSLVAVFILGAVVLFFFIVVGLPVFLYHRREVLRMSGLSNRQTMKLSDRVAALEKRCDTLEERIAEAHLLLADEQRQMDRKLSAILPDAPAPIPDAMPDEKERSLKPQKSIGNRG